MRPAGRPEPAGDLGELNAAEKKGKGKGTRTDPQTRGSKVGKRGRRTDHSLCFRAERPSPYAAAAACERDKNGGGAGRDGTAGGKEADEPRQTSTQTILSLHLPV